MDEPRFDPRPGHEHVHIASGSCAMFGYGVWLGADLFDAGGDAGGGGGGEGAKDRKRDVKQEDMEQEEREQQEQRRNGGGGGSVQSHHHQQNQQKEERSHNQNPQEQHPKPPQPNDQTPHPTPAPPTAEEVLKKQRKREARKRRSARRALKRRAEKQEAILSREFEAAAVPGKDFYEKITKIKTPWRTGYVFVPKGNLFITRTCKRITKGMEQTVFIVKHSNETLGIQVPRTAHKIALTSHKATLLHRTTILAKREARIKTQALQCLKSMFTAIPPESAEDIIKSAFAKNSNHVGRKAGICLPEKLRLATIAHIRHSRTVYDQLCRDYRNHRKLRAGRTKKFKEMVWPEIVRIWGEWGGVRPAGECLENAVVGDFVVPNQHQPGEDEEEDEEANDDSDDYSVNIDEYEEEEEEERVGYVLGQNRYPTRLSIRLRPEMFGDIDSKGLFSDEAEMKIEAEGEMEGVEFGAQKENGKGKEKEKQEETQTVKNETPKTVVEEGRSYILVSSDDDKDEDMICSREGENVCDSRPRWYRC